MASAVLTATQAASPSALDEWVSGERDSPACVELLELAAAVSPAGLRALTQELPTVGGASWLQGADVERFLGLIVALLASEDAEVACAAATAFLAALRCLGNGTPGLFHPLALHELCKSLPAVLCSGDAVPAPRKKGRRMQQQDSDEDEEMEDAGAPLPAKAADGLAGELCLFLEAVPLVCYPETLSQLVSALVEAAACGAGSRVYLPLTCCLGSEHGELASTARTVLRSLKPSLTLTRETSPNQSAAEAQTACVDFLIRLCKHNANSAEPRTKALQHVVQTLLQHAAVGAPDKAEARALVCNAVCAVLAALPTVEAVRYRRASCCATRARARWARARLLCGDGVHRAAGGRRLFLLEAHVAHRRRRAADPVEATRPAHLGQGTRRAHQEPRLRRRATRQAARRARPPPAPPSPDARARARARAGGGIGLADDAPAPGRDDATGGAGRV
jgi:hypothetical protein